MAECSFGQMRTASVSPASLFHVRLPRSRSPKDLLLLRGVLLLLSTNSSHKKQPIENIDNPNTFPFSTTTTTTTTHHYEAPCLRWR